MFPTSTLLLLLSLATVISGDQCVSIYNGQICANYINYTYFLGTNITTAMVETSLSTATFLQQKVGPGNPTCIAEYMKWACGLYYPVCRDNVIYYPCKSQCQRVASECKVSFTEIGMQDQLPQCEQSIPPFNVSYQDDPKNCLTLSPLDNPNSLTSQKGKCQSPLISDPDYPAGTANSRNCFAGCCVPCPSTHLFYKQEAASTGEIIITVIRGISFFLSLFVFTSYAVLPGRRAHPFNTILYIALASMLFSVLAFFTMPDNRSVQCSADGITSANIKTNALCGFQGAYFIFTTFANVMWSSVLVLSLHSHTIWKSTFVNKRYAWMHVFSWGIPAVMTITSAALQEIGYDFGSLCRVTMKSSNPLFFYPLALVIFPTCLLHIWTVWYILCVYAKSRSRPPSDDFMVVTSRSHIAKTVVQQWRSLLFAVILLITFTGDWIFWFTQTARLSSDTIERRTALAKWSDCLLEGTGQDTCSMIIANFAPTLAATVAAEGLTAAIGIWLFILFGLDTRLLRDWMEYLYGMRAGLKRKNSTDNLQRSFLTIN